MHKRLWYEQGGKGFHHVGGGESIVTKRRNGGERLEP